jgi:hypothetical protein
MPTFAYVPIFESLDSVENSDDCINQLLKMFIILRVDHVPLGNRCRYVINATSSQRIRVERAGLPR